MKSLYLVLSRIHSDFLKNKLMMTLYVIGSILCVLVFIYFYSNIQILFQEYNDFIQSCDNRSYMVSLSSSCTLTSDDLSFLDGIDGIENIKLMGMYKQGSNVYTLNTYSSVEYIKRELLNENEVSGLLQLAEDSLNDNVIFTGSKENTLTVDGIIFKNIYTDTALCNYMPLNTFIRNGFSANSIAIVFSQYPSVSESSVFKNLLRESLNKYPIDFIKTPYDNNASYLYNELLYEILRLCLIYIISFIGCAFLFKYTFDLNRNENIVYSIVGASKFKVTKTIFLEAVVMSIGSIIAAIILHTSLYDSFFAYINCQEIIYTFSDYCIIGLFSLILSLLTLIPFFIPYIKNPIMESKIRFK